MVSGVLTGSDSVSVSVAVSDASVSVSGDGFTEVLVPASVSVSEEASDPVVDGPPVTEAVVSVSVRDSSVLVVVVLSSSPSSSLSSSSSSLIWTCFFWLRLSSSLPSSLCPLRLLEPLPLPFLSLRDSTCELRPGGSEVTR